jgi:hypothetical protein
MKTLFLENEKVKNILSGPHGSHFGQQIILKFCARYKFFNHRWGWQINIQNYNGRMFS